MHGGDDYRYMPDPIRLSPVIHRRIVGTIYMVYTENTEPYMYTSNIVYKTAYLLGKFEGKRTSIIKLVKLMVIADVYTMRNHALSFLDGEKYFAMKNGPVPSRTTDFINTAEERLNENEITALRSLWRKATDGGTTWDIIELIGEPDMDHVSEFDIEVLDRIFEEYGSYTPEQLIEETHKYHAWKKHGKALEAGSKREVIDIADFFTDDDGPGRVERGDVERAKRCFFIY